jgi:hypothetical protein
MMMKSKNQESLLRNDAALMLRTFLAGFFENGNLFNYRPKGPLISLLYVLAEKPNAVYAMYLQPVFLNRM